MQSEEQILEQAALDGSIDIEQWPRVLETVLQRLRHIIHNDFPIPSNPFPESTRANVDPEVVTSTPPRLNAESSTQELDLPDLSNTTPSEKQASQESVKENEAPTNLAAGQPPALATYSSQPDTMPPPSVDVESSSPSPIPPALLSAFRTSERTLRSDFADSPPHTIQRLAELVLRPNRHYRYLPSYLRALDRVVSVTSPISEFPLTSYLNSTHSGSGDPLVNGESQINGGYTEREGLGSDESLGGALLTPIPWLRHPNEILVPNPTSHPRAADGTGEFHSEATETIDGPHGAGSIETVSVTMNGASHRPANSTTPNPSATSPPASHNSPTSPTLSEQSDASTGSATSSLDVLLREQGGLSQGELLRREQEAGVVPVHDHGVPRVVAVPPSVSSIAGAARSHSTSVGVSDDDDGGGAAAAGSSGYVAVAAAEAGGVGGDSEIDGPPHARGPTEIGVEDTGPQPFALEDLGVRTGPSDGEGEKAETAEAEEIREKGGEGKETEDSVVD